MACKACQDAAGVCEAWAGGLPTYMGELTDGDSHRESAAMDCAAAIRAACTHGASEPSTDPIGALLDEFRPPLCTTGGPTQLRLLAEEIIRLRDAARGAR
jgi:hypothetical protein